MVLFAVVFVIVIVIYHYIIFIYQKIVDLINSFVKGVNRVIDTVCGVINWINDKFNKPKKSCGINKLNEIEARSFNRLSLPMQSYPDCEACNCENVQTPQVKAQIDITIERINESVLVDSNSISNWNWNENSEYSIIQGFCDQYPYLCDANEESFKYAINQGFAGFSGPAVNGKDKIQRIPIATWMSQESRVGAQAFTVSWSQMLNSMNARERYFENQSVIKTTVKNKDFNNVEQVSDTFTDQPLILVVDQGTLSQLGGAGSLLTFTDLEKLQDPNLTGATKNQFNKNSVTGSTLSNNGQLVNVTVNYAKRDYN